MDKKELLKLYRTCFPFDKRDDGFCNHIFETSVVVSTGEKLKGAAVFLNNTIYMLAVFPEYRNQGIGSTLLKLCEEQIKEREYDKIIIGVGKEYLMPGVPCRHMLNPEPPKIEKLYCCPELNDDAVEFLEKRGYRHSWNEGNCFDMEMTMDDFPGADVPLGGEIDGITYRLAEPEDIEKIKSCTDDAEQHFTQYYDDPSLYDKNSRRRVMAGFDGDLAVGALIIGDDGDGEGSIGCTAVREAYRGRKIATHMVKSGVAWLKNMGLNRSCLGYTYSGLDKLYGCAGFKISVYYMMAEKKL